MYKVTQKSCFSISIRYALVILANLLNNFASLKAMGLKIKIEKTEYMAISANISGDLLVDGKVCTKVDLWIVP